MTAPADNDGLDGELRRDKPVGTDIEARQWQSEIAARLFGQPTRQVKIGRYVVEERVGEGATGAVYCAHDPELDRRVAIKLLRADAALPGDRADTWLAREAKTLARLSHPNVLPVYDVGNHDDQVFMAVEFVTGTTLREWLEQVRTLPEILDVFTQAGQGLAAAHEAGLVHRDFKPANVLIGDDGRVRVADFGIAWHLDAEPVPSTGDAAKTDPSGDALPTHGRAGTPAYMAPEQFLGDPVDGRTDQFGYCVALHEALYGARPFVGTARATLAANVIAGRRITTSDREPPPRWLDRLVARGLAVNPDDRFASMRALLDQLAHRQPWRRNRWVVVGATVGLAASIAATALNDDGAPCSDGLAQLLGVWGPHKTDRIAAAFEASGVSYADDSLRRVGEAVDSYGARWVATYSNACAEVSEAVVVRRMHCLRSRLLELESLGDVLANADATVVEHAVWSVGAMVGPDTCLYVGGETSNPDDATHDEDVAQLRWTIARAKVLGAAGRPREGLTMARQAALDAQSVADRALEAEALLVTGSIERALAGVASSDEAESSIYKAILAAESAHRPDLTARALVEYLGVAETLGHFGRLDEWERRARQAVIAVGSPPALLGRIEYTMAVAYGFQGETQASRAAALRALAEFTRGDDDDQHHMGAAYNILGELTFGEGRYEAALPYYERAFEIALAKLGPNHPWTASAHGNMAEVHFKMGRYEESLASFQEALAIRLDVFGPQSVWSVHGMAHVGDLLLELGRTDEAIDVYERGLVHRKALAAFAGERPASGTESLSIYRDLQAWDQEQWLHHGLALAYVERGELDKALEHATAIATPTPPADRHHPDLIGRLDVHGRVLLAMGRVDAAVEALQTASRTMDAWYDVQHPYRAWPHAALGIAELERGNAGRAREYLQTALRLREPSPRAHPRALGDNRYALARAMWELGDDAEGALQLAREAHDDYKRAPNARADDVASVEAWLLAHEGPVPAPARP